ncbi:MULTISPECIES: hypothetical protein [unclassified Bradyrhizobium]|uniref:hypothetical protein n=1 Tax=unclassified Bradyrhizobium TaxID=2631580 RepID=UPI001BA88CDE|nr:MULTISPECIES: hypothetical protein [unclassified Bradyrhizobium]MBR1208369.1 hypothetical protein [Bradyrhizobium sp. AUGA SZCCT0124]MBR1315214.1 hypothetical protein [Bradyrhizobium sp. AUGA SZCCT0051]MBR1345006.1 hypothetical protein [Bradyrhizobium sp. AUGA SZCCT0105]MBR1357718.1 hypothetical protein [Bradyrhizobium sp. AUGA SZCCT0045]
MILLPPNAARVAEHSLLPGIVIIQLRRWRIELDRMQLNAGPVVLSACNTIVDDMPSTAAQRNWQRSIATTHPQRETHTRHSRRLLRCSARIYANRWHSLCIATPCSQREWRRNVARSPRKQRESESKAKAFRAAVFAPNDVPALE